jgi:hypothetical protein
MRNTEKVRRSAAPNLLVQFPLAELTLQLTVDPSKSRRSIPARADGKSQRSIPAKADGRFQQEPTVDPNRYCLSFSSWLAVGPDLGKADGVGGEAVATH